MSTTPDTALLEAEIAGLRARLAQAEAELRRLRESPAHAAERATVEPDGIARRALLSVIEDQQRASEEIRRVKAQMDSMLDSIDQAVWSVDAATHRVIYVNRAAGEIYGRPTREFYDTPSLWIDTVIDEDRAVALGIDRTTRETGRGKGELRIRRPSGEIRWTHNSAVLVRDDKGNPLRLEGVVSDITEQKLAAIALAESEQQFRGIVEQSLAGLYIIQDGRLVYVNPRYAAMFGYASPEDLIGRDVLSLVAESHRNQVDENIRRRVTGEVKAVGYGSLCLRKDGTTFEVEAHGAAATYRGRPAVIGLVQDVSDKRLSEKKIQRYIEQLHNAFMRTVEVAMNLSEMRDPYTAGHERRVAEVAVAIGRELGLEPDRLDGLRVAGYLHDIGKISIPAEILSKPGKLTPVEYNLIKGHPQAGFEVLKNVEFPWPVAQVALQHHERIDGTGYPQRLKGEDILFEARIMAVADVIEAMSSHRPYRPGLGIEKALEEIGRGRGTSYDPVVADACLRLFREKGYVIPE